MAPSSFPSLALAWLRPKGGGGERGGKRGGGGGGSIGNNLAVNGQKGKRGKEGGGAAKGVGW